MSSHPRGSSLSVTVVPHPSTTTFELTPDESLRVRVAAPPVEGAANAALLRFLAAALGIPRSRLSIVTGQSSLRKRIAVAGIAPDALLKCLRDVLGGER